MPRLSEIFTEIAPSYERANRVLTLGLDRRWRRIAAGIAAAGGGRLALDVCAGTGDMAEALAARLPESARIVALDFSAPMMEGLAAKKEFARRGAAVRADARRLPFPEATFDLVTISFAVRNINRSAEILRETFEGIRRIVKPGGRFILVETSRPTFGPVRWIYFALVRLLVRRVGERLSGSPSGYAYLAETIPGFYGAEDLAAILREAGFARVGFRRLFLGAAAVHVAVVTC
ncbi:MAG: ubiquinone/menaquinone biosynthesis methyltransferase [Candidatus Aminicenantales bacterium]